MNIKSLNKRNEILETIIDFQNENGFPPSVRELCDLVVLKSTASVHYHLNELQTKGLIKIHKKISRGIQVL